jgi:MFS family permease
MKKKQHVTFPDGLRLIALARSVRWVGWGFGEALLPIFLLHFSKTLAQTGLLKSLYEVVSIGTLPLIGFWADRCPAKRLIIVSLALYPLIGIGYLVAGVSGMLIPAAISLGLNGFLWEMENIGVATYYRRLCPPNVLASAFGYLDTVSNLGWICAALSASFLVLLLPIHYLLFAIAPTAILAWWIARKAPEDTFAETSKQKTRILHPYREVLLEWRTWASQMWLLAALIVLCSILNALASFFIPLDAFVGGASLWSIPLLAVVNAIPSLFGFSLGKLADSANKYVLIPLCLFATVVVLLGLAIFPRYGLMIVASFFVGLLMELFSVVQSGLATTLGPASRFGTRGSAVESISAVGDLLSPIGLGFGMDLIGFSYTVTIVAVLSTAIAILYWITGRKLASERCCITSGEKAEPAICLNSPPN